MPSTQFWNEVRVQVARQATRWSCGTEGRLLYENLVEDDDWQFRLIELAPENSEKFQSPASTAAAIVTNYFARSLE
jgi:hypothetical protein